MCTFITSTNNPYSIQKKYISILAFTVILVRLTLSQLSSSQQQQKYLKVAYELCESNLKIGSAKGCHVHLDGKDIKSRHAEIRFQDGKYIIQDLGSKSGTYLKIKDIELTPGIAFMIGSQMIEVDNITTDRKLSMNELYYLKQQVLMDRSMKKTGHIGEFEMIESSSPPQDVQAISEQMAEKQSSINIDNENCLSSEQMFVSFKVFNYLSLDQIQTRFELQFESSRQNVYTIGRKKINSIKFVNDMEMSGNHAQIVLENNKIYLRDRQSKNGIWMRLSSQEKKSDFFVLQNGMSVRFGYYNDYKCFLGKQKESKAQKGFSYNRVEKYCLNCFKKYHNTMLIPCSHQVYCKDCIKPQCDSLQKKCPECSNEFWDYVEILQ